MGQKCPFSPRQRRIYHLHEKNGKRFNLVAVAGPVYRVGVGGLERISESGSLPQLGAAVRSREVRYLCGARTAWRSHHLGKTHPHWAGGFKRIFPASGKIDKDAGGRTAGGPGTTARKSQWSPHLLRICIVSTGYRRANSVYPSFSRPRMGQVFATGVAKVAGKTPGWNFIPVKRDGKTLAEVFSLRSAMDSM